MSVPTCLAVSSSPPLLVNLILGIILSPHHPVSPRPRPRPYPTHMHTPTATENVQLPARPSVSIIQHPSSPITSPIIHLDPRHTLPAPKTCPPPARPSHGGLSYVMIGKEPRDPAAAPPAARPPARPRSNPSTVPPYPRCLVPSPPSRPLLAD